MVGIPRIISTMPGILILPVGIEKEATGMKCVNLINIFNRTYKKVPVSEAVIRRCLLKKVFLKILQNSHRSICAGVPVLTFTPMFEELKKYIPSHVFSCSFWEIVQNSFCTEHQRTITSQYFPMFYKFFQLSLEGH